MGTDGHKTDEDRKLAEAHALIALDGIGGDPGTLAGLAGQTRLIKLGFIEGILKSSVELHTWTSYHKAKFEEIYRRFTDEMARSDSIPLFTEDRRPDHGNRCALSKRQALLLDLVRKRTGLSQDRLASMFGIDQSTVSRYIDFVDRVLLRALPTAEKVAERVKNSTWDEAKEIVPGYTILVDGSHIPIQRPQDDKVQKEAYSGKERAHTANVTIVANKEGAVIYAGKPHYGRVHDLEMLRRDDPDLGKITDSMKKVRVSGKRKVQCYTDLGYKGVEGMYPGMQNKQPEKKGRGRDLAPASRLANREISRKRMKVEHAIGRIKMFDILCRPYDGTLEDLGTEIQVATGLANFHTYWDKRKRRLRLGF